MRIACVGGGPGGAYLSVLLGRPGSGHEVTLFEQGPRGASAGWGVTLAPGFLDELTTTDPETAARLRAVVAAWDSQVVQLGEHAPVRSPAAGQALRRSVLTSELLARADDLGVDVRYGRRVTDLAELAGYDLVVAADGARSSLRAARADALGTRVDVRPNLYTWLGTTRRFDELTIAFARTEHGWAWMSGSSFEPGTSGFYVELPPATWRGLGLDGADDAEALRVLEGVFADHLRGHPLLPQTGSRGGVPWLRFPRVTNERWHTGSLVLLGDAARTVHYSVGQGTILAMQDAQALARVLDGVDGGDAAALEAALGEYGRRRRAEIAPLQAVALTSLRWFEHVERYARASGPDFAMLYHRRRSTAVARTPVRAYTAAAAAAERVRSLKPR